MFKTKMYNIYKAKTFVSVLFDHIQFIFMG